jgi:hypothetical protein
MNAPTTFFTPLIEKCKYGPETRHDIQDNPPDLCQLSSRPPLQCMCERPDWCKGRMLAELTHNLPNDLALIEDKMLWYAAFGEELDGKSGTVEASFLQWLLTNPRAVGLISVNGIHVKNIKIQHDLNLDSATIGFPIHIKDSEFSHNIILRDAKTRFITFEKSTCNSIKAERIHVEGSFILDGFTAKEKVDLGGAQISGDLNCSGGRFLDTKEALTLDRAEIGGRVRLDEDDLHECFKAQGEVSLREIKINGSLVCSGGRFINRYDLRLEVASDSHHEEEIIRRFKSEFELKPMERVVLIVRAPNDSQKWTVAGFRGAEEFCTIVIEGADHALSKELIKDTFNRSLIAERAISCLNIAPPPKNAKALTVNRAQIHGGVFLDDKFEAQSEVSLKGAKITGNLDCCGGSFQNLADDNPTEQNEIYTLNTNLAEINGDVRFAVSSKDKDVCFESKGHILAIGMRVKGDFDCAKARIENKVGTYHAISFDRSIIEGSIFLRNSFSACGAVRLIETKIKGSLDCSGGSFKSL